MNADPFRKLPTKEQYRDDLARWPDMHQMPEPETNRDFPWPRWDDWLGGVLLAIAGLALFFCAFGFGGPL